MDIKPISFEAVLTKKVSAEIDSNHIQIINDLIEQNFDTKTESSEVSFFEIETMARSRKLPIVSSFNQEYISIISNMYFESGWSVKVLKGMSAESQQYFMFKKLPSYQDR